MALYSEDGKLLPHAHNVLPISPFFSSLFPSRVLVTFIVTDVTIFTLTLHPQFGLFMLTYILPNLTLGPFSPRPPRGFSPLTNLKYQKSTR